MCGLGLLPFSAYAVEVVSGPTLTMNPNGNTPLAGVVELETDEPVLVQLTLTDGADVRTVSFPDAAQRHYLPVLGLKPGRTTTVDVTLVPGGLAGTVLATTPALPADFPLLVTHVSVPQAMEPGYTLLDQFSRGTDPRPRYAIIVDSAGEVVWYTTEALSATRQLPNGELLWRTNQMLFRMDMLGKLTSIPLQDPGLGLHHDLEPTPHGTYLGLSARSVEVPDFPSSDTDPNAPRQTATVRDEPVVEFLPDGTVRREWSLLDILHPLRIGYDSLRPTTEGLDWVHTNAVVYSAEDDSIVVSARHQDAVFKFSRATGQLIWILGPHDNWPAEFQPFLLDPVGTPFRWQFHEHAPMWTPYGTLVLFDNGNRRASPFDGTTPLADSANFSRGVEFEIDEPAKQVRQLWEYGESAAPRLYSFFISDANWMPATGNRLIVFGGTSYVGGVSSASLGLGPSHTRVVEVTNDVVPVKVFDMTMYDPAGSAINVYRGARLLSLYPAQYVKTPNGVGKTLRMRKVAGAPLLFWSPSPADPAHTAADYYIAFVARAPYAVFSMFDSTANRELLLQPSPDNFLCYMVMSANSAGRSPDLPPGN